MSDIYKKALQKIAALQNVTQIRGPLEDIGIPDQYVDEDGWVPIHPQMLRGLQYAARIAEQALCDVENIT